MTEPSRPTTRSPALACDSHMHIFDARFASGKTIFPNATVQDYRGQQALTGTERTVVVQPRAMGFDNAVTLDAIAQLGMDRARGIAVVPVEVTDSQLQSLHDSGIRGIRFTLFTPNESVHQFVPKNPVVSFDMVEKLAQRVKSLGWHLQLHWTADQIADHRDVLKRLPTPMVFDHLARLPVPGGLDHPAFGIVRELLGQGRTWVKLSGAYLDSRVGAAGGYADTDAVAQAWVAAAPERMVWGSDWPHPSAEGAPDDALLFDILARWSGNEAVRQRILVDNPAELYGFAAG